jgi:hypothetical protein
MHENEPKTTLGSAIHGLTEELSSLVRAEIALAQLEITTNLSRLGKGSGTLLSAGFLAIYGLSFLFLAGMMALALLFHLWLAALLVALILLGTAAVLTLLARKRLRAASLTSKETVARINRDIAVIRDGAARIREGRS